MMPGGQRLLDGSQRGVPAVAPLVQTRPRGIQHDGDLILVDGELDLMHRAALLKPGLAVGLPQPLYRRLFDDRLAVGDAVQLGIQRPALDRERVQAADKVLKRQLRRLVKQLGKGHRTEAAQYDQHPLRRAQVDVGPNDHRKVPLKGHLAVGGLYLLAAHALDLPGEHALQTEQAGAADGEF